MPTFASPSPATIAVDVPFGRLHVVAGDRDDVVVTVLPSDPASAGSRRAAAEVRVDRDGNHLVIAASGSWKQWVLPFAAGTADVTVEAPAGSSVNGRAGSVLTEGPLATVELTLAAGDARVDRADRVDLHLAAGTATVGTVTATTAIKVGAGSVRIADLTGEGSIRAANGSTTVGAVRGTLEVQGAHGEIAVGRVRGTLTARSAHGGIRVDRVESGSLALTTSFGSIEVGVPDGTTAWLDMSSEFGAVRNRLTPTAGPVEGEPTAEISAHTRYGQILVRRH